MCEAIKIHVMWINVNDSRVKYTANFNGLDSQLSRPGGASPINCGIKTQPFEFSNIFI